MFTKEVLGRPKVLVPVDPVVEDHQQDNDAVVSDDSHPGAELTLILDVHEHAEQGDPRNTIACGLQQKTEHVC